MLKEFVEAIAGMARKSTEANLVDLNRQERLLVVGEHRERIEIDPPVRRHKLDSVQDVRLFIENCANDVNSTVVWVGAAGVTVILDDTERLDKGIMDLEPSPQYTTLYKCNGHAQKVMVQLLRIGAFGDVAPNLLGPVMEMQWQTHGSTAGMVRHDKESLGRNVEQEVKGGQEEIPEEVSCQIPVFDNPSLTSMTATVACAVILDHEAQRISLHPKTMEMAKCWRVGRAQLAAELITALKGLDVPVLMGDPH